LGHEWDASGFEYIDAIRYGKWLAISSDWSNADSPLDCLVNDKDALREILRTVAKGMIPARHIANDL